MIPKKEKQKIDKQINKSIDSLVKRQLALVTKKYDNENKRDILIAIGAFIIGIIIAYFTGK